MHIIGLLNWLSNSSVWLVLVSRPGNDANSMLCPMHPSAHTTEYADIGLESVPAGESHSPLIAENIGAPHRTRLVGPAHY
jgi:hypothetical protein